MPAATPTPLTRGAFAEFGAVIDADGIEGRAANDGRARRFDQPVALSARGAANDAALALYAIDASNLPLTIDHLECHPETSQLFIPMSAARYLVVAAAGSAGGGPSPDTLRAFVATSAQGICYAPGVWHYPLVSLERAATFAMFMWQAPDAVDDCKVCPLDEPVEVQQTGNP